MAIAFRSAPIPPHVGPLDGLRGIAALVVLLSHAQILSGARSLLGVNWGSLAVDLFIMISGFVMVYTSVLRRDREPWDHWQTARQFWHRRYFRIAPLYYVLLAVALLLGPQMGAFRDAIAEVWPRTATEGARYLDTSLTNILAHVTFVFGAIPEYSFRTVLPDWSIGLEMQFYLVFPLLMLLVMRFGVVPVALATTALSFLAVLVFRPFFDAFPMPSALPLRLHIFWVGMLLGFGIATGRVRSCCLIALGLIAASAVVFGIKTPIKQAAVAIAFFYILDDGSLPLSAALRPVLDPLRRLFSGRVATLSGDLSYAVYLLHLLILLPVAGLLVGVPGYLEMSGTMRFLLVIAIVIPLTGIGAWLLHHAVERPGILFGRRLSQPAGRPAV
jgi:peptidoglycan/LPS O-acetylase OafA/YrhL